MRTFLNENVKIRLVKWRHNKTNKNIYIQQHNLQRTCCHFELLPHGNKTLYRTNKRMLSPLHDFIFSWTLFKTKCYRFHDFISHEKYYLKQTKEMSSLWTFIFSLKNKFTFTWPPHRYTLFKIKEILIFNWIKDHFRKKCLFATIK